MLAAQRGGEVVGRGPASRETDWGMAYCFDDVGRVRNFADERETMEDQVFMWGRRGAREKGKKLIWGGVWGGGGGGGGGWGGGCFGGGGVRGEPI